MPRGGRQPGAGRPKGVLNKATIEKKIVEEELKQRILKNAQRILDAQFTLAQGCSFLYKIEKDEKGKNKRPELITDSEVIESYLAGELDYVSDEYYYITTEKPNEYSINSLFDRVFGKPKQSTDITTDGQPINQHITQLTDEQLQAIVQGRAGIESSSSD